MGLDHLSFLTTKITLSKNGNPVSWGTGFFFSHKPDPATSITYLVTNYHVLTGHEPGKGEPPIGDSINFYVHRDHNNPGNVKDVTLPLFTKSGIPIWVTNQHVPQADLAVIPVPAQFLQDCPPTKTISKEWITATDLEVRPATDLVIIGYPYGFYDEHNRLPIWKSGNVASEPETDFNGTPVILADISAFRGMSGSPAFAIGRGAFERKDGNYQLGRSHRFLGIYASNIIRSENKYLEELAKDEAESVSLGIRTEESLQLGNIWKADLIVSTIENLDIDAYIKNVLLGQ